MKFAEKHFPMGSYPRQRTAGQYLDGTLSQNLDIYAKRIKDDMHFLGLVCGNDSVGNGKSTMATHVGAYLTDKINELHGTKNTFGSENMFFNSNELIKKSPTLPKYSVVVLDEGDDLTTHGMKALAVRLKRYFRKCRQLNQIIILILPAFFELGRFYAMARSHFLINVKFEREFERGYFDFYGPTAKKNLYKKGKRDWNYGAWRSDFSGVFTSTYSFFPNLDHEIKKYKWRKYKDMVTDAEEQLDEMSPIEITRLQTRKLFRSCWKVLKGVIPHKQLAKAFGFAERTTSTWVGPTYNDEGLRVLPAKSLKRANINNLSSDKDDGEEVKPDE